VAQFQIALQHLLLPAVVAFLLLGSILALVLGFGLVTRAKWINRLSGRANRWVSTQQAVKGLDQAYNIEQAFRQHRRLLGAAFLVPASISLAMLFTRFDVAVLAQAFPRRFPAFLGELAATFLKWLLLTGNLLAAAVGAALLLFPVALVKLEAPMNKWYATRTYSADPDVMYLPLDKWTDGHPRLAGLIVIVLSSVAIMGLGTIMLQRG